MELGNIGNQVKLELNNLTCRICLRNDETSNSLFDVVVYEDEIELKDVLKRVANVNVPHDEVLRPTRICNDCTKTLLGAYEFIRRIEKAEALLDQSQLDVKHPVEELVYSDYTVENNELEILDEEFEVLVDDYITDEIKDVPEDDVDTYKYPPSSDDTKEENNKHEESQTLDIGSPDLISTSSRTQRKKKRINFDDSQRNSWHKCEECKRNFARIETLHRHMKTAHTYAAPEEIAAMVATTSNIAKEQFKCNHCPRTFARNDNLSRHSRLVHGIKIEYEEELSEKKNNSSKRGLCPYCGESFSQASLVVHIRRHTGETPYKCDSCSKGFPRRQDLIIHRRMHTGERPHVCTLCAKRFARPNKLSRHMRIHTGERPYKCGECGRSFSQSNDLNIHVRRHTGEKPYKCNVCGESFISGTALRSHAKLRAHASESSDVNFDPYAKIRVNKRNLLYIEEHPVKIVNKRSAKEIVRAD